MTRAEHDLRALKHNVESCRKNLERCGSIMRALREDIALADIALTEAAKRYDEAVKEYQDARDEDNGRQEEG